MIFIHASGNVTRDSAIRTTQGGDKLLSFSVAASNGHGDRKHTEFLSCTVWGKRGEALEPYVKKGTAVAIAGRANIRTYEHNGEHRAEIQVNVTEIDLQGGKSNGGQQNNPDWQAPPADDLNDEIPF